MSDSNSEFSDGNIRDSSDSSDSGSNECNSIDLLSLIGSPQA